MENKIEVCKNRSSGKYFIYIQRSGGNDEALLVTPLGEIKSLKMRLFQSPEERDVNQLLSECLLTEKQIERWKQYIEYRAEDIVEYCEILVEQLTPEQRNWLLKELEKSKSSEST